MYLRALFISNFFFEGGFLHALLLLSLYFLHLACFFKEKKSAAKLHFSHEGKGVSGEGE